MRIDKKDITEYREICKKYDTIPMFSKDWWLDAVAPNCWNVNIYKKENGDLIGCFVYQYETNESTSIISRAPLTQTNGIWINKEIFKNYYNYRKYEERLMNSVIQEIYSLGISSYDQQYHHSITNWLPFFWEYFECSVKYTYIIDTKIELNEIFANFSQNNRNSIRKAQKIVTVREDLGPIEFYNLNKQTFERQGLSIPYSFELFCRINDVTNNKNCSKILAAYDDDNKLHAAIYLIWDEKTVYYLLSGSNPEYRNSQANSLLIYEGIKFAKELNRNFDFEGSVIKRVENNVRQFGGKQVPYFRISKKTKEGFLCNS